MATRSRNRRSRDAYAPSPSRRLRSAYRPPSFKKSRIRYSVTIQPSMLEPILDRRTFHPARAMRPLSLSVVYPGGNRNASMLVDRREVFKPTLLSFAVPKAVSVCVRRKERRESLFARGGAGKGKLVRRGRRNVLSSISCRG